MVKIFKTVDNTLVQTEQLDEGCWIALTNPTAEEMREVADKYSIESDDLRASLDEEERSRIEVEDEYTLILVDIPTIEERNEKDWYGTIPLSIIVCNNAIITVCLEDSPVLTAFMDGRVRNFYTYMKTRFIFQILYRNATLYLNYLRIIDRRSDSIEQKLHEATRNRELIELLELEKSLVFFTTSLKSNEVVLEKLLKSNAIKKYPEDEDLIEDVIVENKQAIEMANIYSGILNGTMDTFASVISNNQNSVMKFLTTITIVLSIPTMIASFYGMNVKSLGMPFADSEWGFLIVIGISLIISLIIALIFRKKTYSDYSEEQELYMNFMYKMEKKLGRYAIRNLSLILIICYVAGYIIEKVNPQFILYLTLNPYAIIHGQVWRIFSWILIPPSESNIFFAIIMLLFYYSIGTTLERTWGTFQYNVYLFSGMIFTVIGSFLMMAFCYIFRSQYVGSDVVEANFAYLSQLFSTYYVNMSIFLAYAATFPDNKVLLMFIIPIKVKWLGIVYGCFIVYEMVAGFLLSGNIGFAYPFAIGSSLLNFVVFFFTTRNYIRMNRSQRKMHRQYKRRERTETKAYNSGMPKHRCAVCGRTEKDGDDLVFRFCSKCEGNYEFCQDHLYTHIHFTNKQQ